MESDWSGMSEHPSEIGYSYVAIKVTQSRLQKGLIAFPRALLHLFPKSDTTVQVYLGAATKPQAKKYTHFTSSTRESRIGGLARWFEEKGIKEGDELVIQLLDRERLIYRIEKHEDFINKVRHHQRGLEQAKTAGEAYSHVAALKDLVGPEGVSVALSEFHRLAMRPFVESRRSVPTGGHEERESAPPHLRMLLGEIYGGHCQVCDFTFLKRDGSPYFEIHHLFPTRGHHPKNLVVTCANCHRQFEYARVELHRNDADWLIAVTFNSVRRDVNQAVLRTELPLAMKRMFTI